MKNINIHKLGSLKNDLPRMRTGDTVRVSEKILEESKKKSQVFEGILISKKNGKGVNATFTLRTIIGGVGVEKTYPLHSPLIEEIKVVREGKARRGKLYYIRKKAEKATKKKLKSRLVLERKGASEIKVQENSSKDKEKKKSKEETLVKNKKEENKEEGLKKNTEK